VSNFQLLQRLRAGAIRYSAHFDNDGSDVFATACSLGAEGIVVELHTWNATIDDVERPDRIVFDLDPGPGVPWQRTVSAALQLRKALRQRSLTLRWQVQGAARGQQAHALCISAQAAIH
jgi:hypothetical protein